MKQILDTIRRRWKTWLSVAVAAGVALNHVFHWIPCCQEVKLAGVLATLGITAYDAHVAEHEEPPAPADPPSPPFAM